MNSNIIRREIEKHLNEEATIKVYGMRNKVSTYDGVIKAIFPNIFTVSWDNLEKSFSYADVITGNIKIKYKEI